MKTPWIGAVLLIVPALALILIPDYGADAAFTLPLRGARRFLAAWGVACLGAAIYAFTTRAPWRKGLGMALMFTPLAFTLWSILNNLAPLLAGGKEIVAITPYQLSTAYMRAILIDLGYAGAGFLLWAGWHPKDTVRDIARRLQDSGFPMGRRSEAASLRLGFGWFPVLLVGAILVDLATRGTALVNNDESSIWSLATPWHVIMISLAASVGEETLYRGVLMVSAAVLFGARRGGDRAKVAWAAAIALQGIIFGLAHAGFGNYAHVLQATLFGLVSGFAAYRFGIWSVITLHFLVDIYAIGADVATPAWQGFLVTLLIINVIYSGVAATSWWAARQKARAAV